MKTLRKIISALVAASLLLLACPAFADTLRVEGLEPIAYPNPYTSYSGKPSTPKKVDATWVAMFKSTFPDDKLSATSQGSNASTEKLIQSLESGYKVDVLQLDTYYQDVQTVMASGKLLDLSSSEVLSGVVAQMHPNIAAMAIRDGKLYALPIDVGSLFYVRAQCAEWNLWGLAGCEKDDIPTSFEAYLNFLEDWLQRNDHDPYLFPWSAFNYGNSGFKDLHNHAKHGNTAYLTTVLVRQYVDNCRAQGITPQFDTPAIVTLLERVSSLGSDLHIKEYSKFSASDSIFGDNFGLETNSWGSDLNPAYSLPSRLTDDDPLVFPMRMRLLVVNADTEHPELAVAFLEMYAEMLAHPTWPTTDSVTIEDADTFKQWARLFTDASGDVLYPLQMRKGFQSLLHLEKCYDEAIPALVAGREEAMDDWDLMVMESNAVKEPTLTVQRDTLIFADELERYQQFVSSMVYPLGGSYMEGSDVAKLITRFAKQDITATEFAQSMDALGIR